MSGLRIAAIRLLCPDPERTAAFYGAAFGAAVDQTGTGVAVGLGAGRIELVPTRAARGAPSPSNATGFQHCAIVVSDMEAATARLGSVPGWTAISSAGPERLPAPSGGVTAFKFRDPDGHPLEFLRFTDAGMPDNWRGRPGLFLGIDHTAITVADTERSVAFYAGLGFAVRSRGVNRGVEQERLDGVPAPVVEVTGLTPPAGGPPEGGPPHLELLCYRRPVTTAVVLADDAVLATRTVLDGHGPEERGAVPSILLDPDGHRLLFAG